MQFKSKLALTLALAIFAVAQLTARADSMVDKAVMSHVFLPKLNHVFLPHDITN